MAYDGQADEAPNTIGDVADFLLAHEEEINNDDEPDHSDLDNSDVEENPEEGSEPDEELEEEEESDEDDAEPKSKDADQTTQKFKVTIKGDDGADEEVEVDQKELIAGYQRHSRFTQLAQGLAERERQAAEVVQKEISNGRQYFVQEAQKAQQAVIALAGLRSQQEMDELAITNPTLWVQERNRVEQVQRVLQQIDGAVQQQKQQADQYQQQMTAQAKKLAVEELRREGFPLENLGQVSQDFSKMYKVPMERLSDIVEPWAIRAINDAVAYQKLKAETKAKPKASKPAAKLPAQRQNVPKDSQATKRMDAKFRSGKAGIRDLAAIIQGKY